MQSCVTPWKPGKQPEGCEPGHCADTHSIFLTSKTSLPHSLFAEDGTFHENQLWCCLVCVHFCPRGYLVPNPCCSADKGPPSSRQLIQRTLTSSSLSELSIFFVLLRLLLLVFLLCLFPFFIFDLLVNPCSFTQFRMQFDLEPHLPTWRSSYWQDT